MNTKWQKVVTVALTGAVLASGALYGQEGGGDGWKLSLSYVYRTFGDVDFKGFDMPGYVTGQDPTGQPAGPLGPMYLGDPNQNLPPVGGTNYAVLHRNLDFRGADHDLDAANGFELTAATPVGIRDRLFDLELSLVAVTNDASQTVSDVPVDRQLFNDALGTWVPGGTTSNPTTFAILDYDLDMTVLTHAVGVGTTYHCQDWYVRGAVGPTLTVVDYDATRDISVEDSAAGPLPATDAEHDGEMEFKLGAYARVGAGYNVTDGLSLEIGARYDYIQEVDSKFMDLDLSGLSGNLSLIFMF